jgi:dual-specificity kinase
MQVVTPIFCGQEFGNAAMANCGYISSVFYSGVPRNASPPWRSDDKDGHYVFAIGENLTPRCKHLPLTVKCRSNIKIGIVAM